MRGLRGKNVLVTGDISGIGQAIAVRFAEYGANVAINYPRRPRERRRGLRHRPDVSRSTRTSRALVVGVTGRRVRALVAVTDPCNAAGTTETIKA